MPRTAGVFTPLWQWMSDAITYPNMQPSRFDAYLNDMAAAVNTSLATDGSNIPTANLPLAGFRHTGVGNASARDQYASAGQVQDSKFTYAADTGTVNAYAITLAPVITAYTTGQVFMLVPSITNTAASTLNVNGLGAKAIKSGTADISAGDLVAGRPYPVYYDGTNFQSVSPPKNNVFSDAVFRITGSTDATKLLAFEVDGFTAATTRTITVPNVSGTMYVSGGTDVAIADGGTGASTALAAFDALKQNATTSYAGVIQLRAGQVIQSVYATNAAVVPVTSVVPVDDTVPTTAETTEIVTVAITPTSAASLLRITAFASGTGSSGLQATGCIFRDAATNASVTTFGVGPFTGGAVGTISMQAFLPATATTATTIRFRVGVNGARFDVNGNGAGARYYGGTSFSSILVEEIQV